MIKQLLNEVLAQLNTIANANLANKAVLTLDEAARYTGLSKHTMYAVTSSRQLPHYKQKRKIYIDRVELENWLKQNPVKQFSNRG